MTNKKNKTKTEFNKREEKKTTTKNYNRIFNKF
jgi:hypothetical protein